MSDRPTDHEAAGSTSLTDEATVAGGTGEPIITVQGVDKFFGDFQALTNVNLVVGKQEVLVVIGPSGSGKSTLIRCVNHLEEHTNGTIIVDGVELTEDIRNIQECRRECGMVFQSFNLFPHMTVLDNITLGPRRVRKKPKAAAEEAAMELLEMVKIPEQAKKHPGQLSGGQQQRVAIARALAMEPKDALAMVSANGVTIGRGALVLQRMLDVIDEAYGPGCQALRADPL